MYYTINALYCIHYPINTQSFIPTAVRQAIKLWLPIVSPGRLSARLPIRQQAERSQSDDYNPWWAVAINGQVSQAYIYSIICGYFFRTW